MIKTTNHNLCTRQAQRFAAKFAPRGLLAGALLAVLALAAQTVQAQHGISVQKLDSPRSSHVGDTITAQGTIINNDISLDDWVVTNIFLTIFPTSQPIPPGCATTIVPIPIPGATNVVVTDPCFGTTETVNGILLHPGDTLLVSTTYIVPNCDGKYTVLPNKISLIGIDLHNKDPQLNCPQGNNLEEGPDQVTVLRPCISCTKTCTTVGDGDNASISFSGSISNCGNIALTNVTVIDNRPVANTVVTNFGTNILFPNQTFSYSGSYKAPCGQNVDTINVSGTEQNRGQPVVETVSSSCSTTCNVPCVPVIKVYKQVVCDTSTGCEAFDSPFLNTQKTATGAKLTNGVTVCPTFCYQVTVTNLGDVTLNNLTVTDLSTPGPNILPAATCNFPTSLAPAGQPGSGFSCIVTNIERCDNDVNVVTATAQGLNSFGTNQTVVAKDTNTVVIVPINVKCTLSVSTNGPTGNFFVPTSACATQNIELGTNYCVRITVMNNGGYDLANVTIADELGTFGSCFTSPLNLGSLAVGASVNQDCCNLPCGALGVPTNFKIAVKADVSQANGHICAFDRFGKLIEATNECNTCVVCVGKPQIKVYKQVVCDTSTGCEAFDNNLNNQKTATGAKLTNGVTVCPTFCYRVTVTNTGSVPLTGLTVTDLSTPGPNILPAATCNFPTSLAPAGQPGSSFSCIVTNIERCDNDVNVVTASAQGINEFGTNTTVTAKDTNTVVIVPINVKCTLSVSTNGPTGNFFVPSSGCATQNIALGTNYCVRITVMNNGGYDLANVTITDELGSFGSCFTSPLNLGALATGASVNQDCCNLPCGALGVPTNFKIGVKADVSQANGHICAFDRFGKLIEATNECNTCVVCVGTPQIKVYKQVVCDTSTGCEAFDSPFLNTQKTATGAKLTNGVTVCPTFCYQVTVTNLGNVPLTGLTVTDLSTPGPNILPAATCPFPSSLAPAGQPGSGFSCIVTNIERCDNDVNVVTASAQGINEFGTNTTVTAKDTNTVVIVPINVKCTLSVSTNGPSGTFFVPTSGCATQSLGLGTNYCVRINVMNNGGYDLANVTITDELGTFGGCFTSPLNIGGLAVAGSTNIDCCNLPCGAINIPTNFKIGVKADVSQANGHICAFDRFGKQIQATNECNTCVVCTGCPEIKVFKGIACVVCSNDGSGVTLFCASARGIFEPIAYGDRSDTQDPAFCYEIAVTNSGAIDLQNVTIKDAVLGLNLNIGTLTKGGSGASSAYTNNFLKSLHVTTTNTVIATGDGGAGAIGCPGANASGQVSATNQAVAVVTPISIRCVKLVSVSQDGGPASAFAPSFTATNCGANTNIIVWQAWVTNTGLADLTNVIMTDEAGHSGLPGCTVSNYIASLAAGDVAGPFYLCTNVLPCVDTNIVNFIKVTGEAAQEGTNCVWDIHGSNIVASSDCQASVTLCCVVPTVGCRVTGGGRQDYNDPKADTIEVCPPDSRYVTHGGQVGAPYGNAITNCPDMGDCGNILNQTLLVDNIIGNVCIHGRWTHVRHVKGGLEGNFHARFYDTLDCSCLAVDFDPVTQLYVLGDTTTIPGRCNPGDKIAGPEPRKAPANKIVFTGVGDWADPNGRRTPRSVLFRVDIEDRSEPGGYHPGGAKDPADRYRIRIWVLTPQECAQLHSLSAGPDPGLLHFRSAIAACYGINQRDGVVSTFEQNNCGTAGTMYFGGGTEPRGCSVRLPDIDDGGELKNGNHQIHPQIKPCDPANPQGPGLANSGSDCSNQ